MKIWLLVILVVAIIIYIKKRPYSVPEQYIEMYAGTVGSGKSYKGVNTVLDYYFRQVKRHKRYKRKGLIWKIYRFFVPESRYEPNLYSNIPIRIRGRGKKAEYCHVLKKEHLLMQEKLPEGAIIFIDEVGSFASQWDFDNPQVQEQLQTFLRFFRHFLDGRMVVTDQSVSRVVKPIRELIGRVFWLHDFHRMWKILPIYEVNVIPLMMLDDVSQKEQDDEEEKKDKLRVFRGFLPYKWMRMQRYASRCYRSLYDYPADRKITYYRSYETTYLIDLQVSANVKKCYRADRDMYHDWIYQPRPWNQPPPMP